MFPNALLGNCLLLQLVGPGTWARPFAQRTTQIHRGSNRYLERRTTATSKVLGMDHGAISCGTSRDFSLYACLRVSWSYSWTNDGDMSAAQGKYRRSARRDTMRGIRSSIHIPWKSSNLEKSIASYRSLHFSSCAQLCTINLTPALTIFLFSNFKIMKFILTLKIYAFLAAPPSSSHIKITYLSVSQARGERYSFGFLPEKCRVSYLLAPALRDSAFYRTIAWNALDNECPAFNVKYTARMAG